MIGVSFGAAGQVDGIAQALIALVGVVALLWIGNFLLQGYTETVRETDPDR